MPIFEKPPHETLATARDRWTPLYLQHGRLEVDDSSVKWIGADRTVFRVPIATVSALLLGPGTTVTHAAIKACSDCNTPLCWVGADSMRFYALGTDATHDNSNARKQAAWYASTQRRAEVARRLFLKRFPAEEVAGRTIRELRGMEGRRVRNLYGEMGARYGVTWKGRRYDTSSWDLADNINRAVSAANHCLYALCTAVISSMGFLPQLGFIHGSGNLSFTYDIADLYKPETTLPAAFQTIGVNPQAEEREVVRMLKTHIEEKRLLSRIPHDLENLFE